MENKSSDGSGPQREGERGRREVVTDAEGDGESDKGGGMGQHVMGPQRVNKREIEERRGSERE